MPKIYLFYDRWVVFFRDAIKIFIMNMSLVNGRRGYKVDINLVLVERTKHFFQDNYPNLNFHQQCIKVLVYSLSTSKLTIGIISLTKFIHFSVHTKCSLSLILVCLDLCTYCLFPLMKFLFCPSLTFMFLLVCKELFTYSRVKYCQKDVLSAYPLDLPCIFLLC